MDIDQTNASWNLPDRPIVNCHTHLELGWLENLRPQSQGSSFVPWLYQLATTRRRLAQEVDVAQSTGKAIEQGIIALQATGTTHVGDITATGASVEPLLDSGLAGVVYLEVIGPAREAALDRWQQVRTLLERYRPQERNGMRIGVTPHSPYSTHPTAFRAVTEYCLAEDVPMCIHLAESPAEVEALVQGRGDFHYYAPLLGVEVPPHPGVRPVTYLADLGVLAAKPLLVHMVQVTDEELDLVAAAGAKIAHCPRSNTLLKCGRMPLKKMLARGISIGLGTDSLTSSPSLDVRAEAEAAIALHASHVDPDEIGRLLSNTAVLD